MKRMAVFCLALVLGWAGGVLAANGPRELAGLRLGDTVDAAGSRLADGGRTRECRRFGLSTVAVAPVDGFRSGYVDIGECAVPGRIVRIKMHYADDSLDFFNTILAALKKRYGEPVQWRGNAFGTLRTWKWGVAAADGTQVSVILMHYAGDDGTFTEGNSIRIAVPAWVRQEQQCQAAKKEGAAKAATPTGATAQTLGLEWFLPH